MKGSPAIGTRLLNGLELKHQSRFGLDCLNDHSIAEDLSRLLVERTSRGVEAFNCTRFLKPDVAVAHAESEVVRSEHGKKVPLKTLMTLVLVKDRRAWLITAAENTDVRTPPPSPAK